MAKNPDVSIRDCNFTASIWDKSALDAVSKVAQGLLNLTELFVGQHVTIESLLKVTTEEVKNAKDAVQKTKARKTLAKGKSKAKKLF